MKLQLLSVLGASALLAACCCDTPPSAETGVAGAVMGAPAPGSTEEFVTKVRDRIYFAFDKSELSEEAMHTLRCQAEWLKKYPKYKVTLLGHCDERGSDEYNYALGERRAYAAYNYLVKVCGIPADRLETCSMGKSNPIAVGHTEEDYRKNRVTISLLRGDGCTPAAQGVSGSVDSQSGSGSVEPVGAMETPPM